MTGTPDLIPQRPRTTDLAGSVLLVATLVLLLPGAAQAQMTSSRRAVVLPFYAALSDTGLASDLFEVFRANVSPPGATGVVVDAAPRPTPSRAEVSDILASAQSMGRYADRVGAAFLIAGAVRREPGGEILISLISYSVDDRRAIREARETYPDLRAAEEGVAVLARQETAQNVFTPSDTAIIYSILLPGSGQLMLGEPVHALISVGLVAATLLTYPTASSTRSTSGEHVRNKHTLLVLGAWVINVADTATLIHLRLHKVDASLFYSIVREESPALTGLLPPGLDSDPRQISLGIRIVW